MMMILIIMVTIINININNVTIDESKLKLYKIDTNKSVFYYYYHLLCVFVCLLPIFLIYIYICVCVCVISFVLCSVLIVCTNYKRHTNTLGEVCRQIVRPIKTIFIVHMARISSFYLSIVVVVAMFIHSLNSYIFFFINQPWLQ